MATKVSLTGPGGGGLKKSLQRQFRERVVHKVVNSLTGTGGKSVKISSHAKGPSVKALLSHSKALLNDSGQKLESDWNTLRNSSRMREAIAKTERPGLYFFLPMDRKAIQSAVKDVSGSKRSRRYLRGNKLSMKFGFTSRFASALDDGASAALSTLPRYEHPRNRRPFRAWLDTFPRTEKGVSPYFVKVVRDKAIKGAGGKAFLPRVGVEWQNSLKKYF